MQQRRISAGVPAGGRFTSRDRAEADVRLSGMPIMPSSEAFGDRDSVPDSAYASAVAEWNAETAPSR